VPPGNQDNRIDGDDIERRIRETAYRLWEEEGFPEGKADAHWELAKIAVVRDAARGSRPELDLNRAPLPIASA
jgi:hypothetical protein